MKKKTENNKELVLKLKKDEFFNPFILAPHNEVDSKVYEAVNDYSRHLRRHETFKITIFTNTAEMTLHEKFKELFFEHYDDECHRTRLLFRSRVIKTTVLIIVSLFILFLWYNLSSTVFRELCGTLWAFNLWEAAHTFIEAIEHLHAYQRIRNIKNAPIDFIDI